MLTSYNQIKKFCKNKENNFPIQCKDEDGRDIKIYKIGNVYKVSTFQANNWIKVTYYYPDYNIKETYE